MSDNKISIFLKIITLIYRESLVVLQDNDYKDTVKKILAIYKINKGYSISGSETEIVERLKEIAIDLMEDNDINKTKLLNSIKLILKDKKEIFEIFEEMMKDLTLDENEDMVRSIKNEFERIIKYNNIKKTMNKYSFEFDNNIKDGQSPLEFILKLIQELEELSNYTSSEDKAVTSEVDISDRNKINSLIKEVKDKDKKDGSKLRTGWQAVNRITKDGGSRGEFIVINALQHNYKSGLLATLFLHFIQYNTPKLYDEKRKPLFLFISLEDDLPILFHFIYKYLYYMEFKTLPKLSELTEDDIVDYVLSKLNIDGKYVKFIRVNPTDWTYKHMFALFKKYMKEGFEIINCTCDYLQLIPTTGCNTSGPAGTDLRDLYRRVRNYCAEHNILFLTAGQLSTDAKALLRNGYTDIEFVKYIPNKGYFSGSKQLDQEMDLELYAHIARLKGNYYLCIQRGKHRGAGIISEDDKFAMLPFPKGAPIPADIDGPNIEYKTNEQLSNENNNMNTLLGNMDISI